ncbi:trans-Golgi network integral membrane protein 2 [Anabrus simplex]|uniref:trans-Golgi network integral membrane protein 2 n=1 Tax=Anabrus simplex TaxID=316456 RepID=UPI0035A3B3FB
MTEMSVHKSVVKSNIMFRLMCFLLTLYVDVTFGDNLYRQVVGHVRNPPTFVSEISAVLTWCNLSTVKDVWDPNSFVTSKCNRNIPHFDNSTVLSFSVDFDFDTLLCTSLYDSSSGACYLAHTSNRANINNLMPDKHIPVADKFCNDTKTVLARNASNFINGTRLWIEAFNKNIQDELKCTRVCIAGERINPLCKAVVKLNSVILHLNNEAQTGNIPREPPAAPEKSGNLRTPSSDKISPGNSGLTESRDGAFAQSQDVVNISNQPLPVGASSSSSKENKGLRGSIVQNYSEQASRQLNGAKQILQGNADIQNGKVSDGIETEKGDPKPFSLNEKKTETHSSNGIPKKFNGTRDNPAVNSIPVKPAGKSATPGLTESVEGKNPSGSNFNPSAPSVQIPDEPNAFPSSNIDNTKQHIQGSSDDGLQSGTLPVATEIVPKPIQPQNIGDEIQPAQPSDTASVLGKNTYPGTDREKAQPPNQEKVSENKPEIDRKVPPPTTVSTENLDKTVKMDSSVVTGISNPATVNQLQDTAQRDSIDEAYPETDRIDTLDEDEDVSNGFETAVPEDNVRPVVEDLLVSEERAVPKVNFPTHGIAEEGNAEFVKAEDSHFFAYFMTMIVLCIIGYLVFHNKQKILALALEGRSRRGSRRRPNTAGYRKLDSNLEEAVTSQCSSASVTHVIY